MRTRQPPPWHPRNAGTDAAPPRALSWRQAAGPGRQERLAPPLRI
ncbi:MAG: hypothetical protein ACRDOK_00380 [Streptosporangiaceae bacterium]